MSTKPLPLSQTYECEIDGPDNTYTGCLTNLNVGTAATTDIFTLYGSASMVVRVVQINIAASIATAAAHFDLQVVSRSTTPTAGTPAAVTIAKQDQNDPNATATNVQGYTAAPTAGTLLAVQAVTKLFVPITNASLQSNVQFNFGYGAGAKALILRGVNQGIGITLNGATPANASAFDIQVIWTERLT